jgi:hypothetical protein
MKYKIMLLAIVGTALYLAKKKERITMTHYISKADVIIQNLEKKMENQCSGENLN